MKDEERESRKEEQSKILNHFAGFKVLQLNEEKFLSVLHKSGRFLKIILKES